ncbi:MAG: hypothetical protein ACRCWG_02190 [Sarcina sp.]
MDSLEVNEFDGTEISTYLFEEKKCWVGSEIGGEFGYVNPSKATTRCIEARMLKKGLDYDILDGDRLKKFKLISYKQCKKRFSRVPKIIIFYKNGLREFMLYSEKKESEKIRELFEALNIDLYNDEIVVEEKFQVENEEVVYKKEKIEIKNKRIIHEELTNSDRNFYKKNLLEILQLMENVSILDDDFKDIKKECLERLVNISKYLIDKLG